MPDIQGPSLAIIIDKLAGGNDYLKSVEAGIAALGEIAPNVQTWDPKPEVYITIVYGQATLGVGWNARAQVNSDTSNGKLGAVPPQEGSVFQINTINLVEERAPKRRSQIHRLRAEAGDAGCFTEEHVLRADQREGADLRRRRSIARRLAHGQDDCDRLDRGRWIREPSWSNGAAG